MDQKHEKRIAVTEDANPAIAQQPSHNAFCGVCDNTWQKDGYKLVDNVPVYAVCPQCKAAIDKAWGN
jgi:hypothetical protein